MIVLLHARQDYGDYVRGDLRTDHVHREGGAPLARRPRALLDHVVEAAAHHLHTCSPKVQYQSSISMALANHYGGWYGVYCAAGVAP